MKAVAGIVLVLSFMMMIAIHTLPVVRAAPTLPVIDTGIDCSPDGTSLKLTIFFVDLNGDTIWEENDEPSFCSLDHIL